MQKIINDVVVRQVVANHLTLLKPLRRASDGFGVSVTVSSYSDVPYKIASLLKSAAIALDPENGSAISAYDVIALLELALGLLPYEEFELLDILFEELMAGEVEVPVAEVVLYNYSTVRVLGVSD